MKQFNLEELHKDKEYGKSYVMCPLCDKKFRSLVGHVSRTHQMWADELNDKHPGIILEVEEVVKRRTMRSRRKVR